jgi:hypothetical protein
MKPFTPPPLKIVVQKLDGVDNRPFNHLLTPEDIRKDSCYQMLARRNAVLERRERQTVYMVLLAALIVTALNAFVITPVAHKLDYGFIGASWEWFGKPKASESVSHSATKISTPVAPMQPGAVLAQIPASAPAPAPASATVQPHPEQQPPQSDAANQLAAALRALIDQQAPKVQPAQPQVKPTPGVKPITVIPSIDPAKGITTAAPVQATAKPTAPVQESAPVKPVTPLSIIDFLGTNTAVLLSSDGGQSMRTYRVGDALPSGEVVKVIDSVNGSITTTQRTVKR